MLCHQIFFSLFKKILFFLGWEKQIIATSARFSVVINLDALKWWVLSLMTLLVQKRNTFPWFPLTVSSGCCHCKQYPYLASFQVTWLTGENRKQKEKNMSLYWGCKCHRKAKGPVLPSFSFLSLLLKCYLTRKLDFFVIFVQSCVVEFSACSELARKTSRTWPNVLSLLFNERKSVYLEDGDLSILWFSKKLPS